MAKFIFKPKNTDELKSDYDAVIVGAGAPVLLQLFKLMNLA